MLKLWSLEIPTHVKVRHLNNVLHALLDCSNAESGRRETQMITI